MEEIFNLDNIENDPIVKEIFALADTEEIQQMAKERFESAKAHRH